MESGLAWRLPSSAENFRILDFLNIYMVSAPSASDFLEVFGIHNVSWGLYLQILVHAKKSQNFEAEGAKTMRIPKNSKNSKFFEL